MSQSVPRWSLEPFAQFFEYTRDVSRILRLSVSGISALRAMPDAVRLLAKHEWIEPKGAAEQIARAEDDARVAASEAERGFPLLHAHATVALWGAAEAMIEEVVVAWLLNDPETIKLDAFSKQKLSIAEFETLAREERMLLLVREAERGAIAQRRQGVDRFEALLDPLGLSGSLEDGAKRAIFEMHQIRNIIVHRAGRADRRLASACPWLGLQVGDPVTVGRDRFSLYEGALGSYLVELIHRVERKFGYENADEGRTGTGVQETSKP